MADRAIHRERTALRRESLSSPTAAAMNDQLIAKDTTVLNFGCGHNDDGRLLCAQGVDASGWDRYFTPHVRLDSADVVLLNFVINTIESPAERESIVLIAYALARQALVISVRTDRQGWKGRISTYSDGIVTEHETFQKIYLHEEFCQEIADILQWPVYGVKSGIAYVFRDSRMGEEYLIRHPNRRQKIYQPRSR